MLERKDRRILAELQRDSRLTMQELAERVGMSGSACWRRVKSLEESGVIDRYAVIVNGRKADFHLRVVVEDIDAYNKFLDDFIFKLPGVSQVRSNFVLKEIKADTALPFRQ